MLSIASTCGVDEANSARETLVTAVVISDVGRFVDGERRADDGESGTGLDISITRLEEAKKVVAADILSPIAQLLVVASSFIFLRPLQIDSKCGTRVHCIPSDAQCSAQKPYYYLSNWLETVNKAYFLSRGSQHTRQKRLYFSISCICFR